MCGVCVLFVLSCVALCCVVCVHTGGYVTPSHLTVILPTSLPLAPAVYAARSLDLKGEGRGEGRFKRPQTGSKAKGPEEARQNNA